MNQINKKHCFTGSTASAETPPARFEGISPIHRREWISSVLPLVLIALLLKWLYLWSASSNIFVLSPTNDEMFFLAEAKRILEQGVIQNSAFYFEPLYSYLLAGYLRLFGDHLLGFKAIQSFIGALNVGVVYWLARLMFQRRLTAVCAAVLTITYGMFYFCESLLLKTTFAVFLTNSALLAIAFSRVRGLRWPLIPAGILLGLTTILRGNTLIITAFLIAGLAVDSWLNRKSKWVPVLCLAGFLIGVSPTAIHNAVVARDFVLTTYQGGSNLYIGNHDGATGIYVPLRTNRQMPEWEREDAISIAEAAAGRKLKPSEIQRYWISKSVEFAANNPLKWVGLTWKKFRMFHSNQEFEDSVDYGVYRSLTPVLYAAFLPFGLVVALAAAGIVLSMRTWRIHLVWYITILGMITSVILFFLFSRYRLSASILHFMFAAYALDCILCWWRQRNWKPLVQTTTAVGLLALFTLSDPLDISPAATYNNMGLKYMKRQDYAIAADCFQKALSHTPDAFGMQFNLGKTLANDRQFERARSAFLKCLQLIEQRAGGRPDPIQIQQKIETLQSLMALSREMNRPDEAGQYLKKIKALAIEQLQNNTPAHLQSWVRGARLFDEGRYDQALPFLQEAVRTNPQEPEILVGLARCYMLLRQPDPAMDLFTRALEIKPDDPSILVLHGKCSYLLGKYPEALTSWKKALDLGLNDPQLRERCRAMENGITR